MRRDKTLVVHERKEAHDELAVHAIGDAAVAGDALAEVFDFEGAFEARGEEAAEGRDERGEGCEDENVELHGRDVVGALKGGPGGEGVRLGDEDGVGGAGEAGENVGAEVLGRRGGLVGMVGGVEGCLVTYIDWADEIGIPHEDVGEDDSEEDGEDPGADEAFDGFLRGELDELRAAECYTADVGPDVVCDDEAGWEEEPDHAFENVVHDKVGLNHD